ncbi:MAG: hypothetical protein EPO32_04685 [Anaerolineae bacterium]|nr:MAG: hypothetical protein EPO32_04685 [Anaerolineae bacterium]
MLQPRLLAIVLLVAFVLAPLAPAFASVPRQECVPGVAPGEWLGTYSQTYTASQSESGLNVTGTSVSTGTIQFFVSCDGAVSGTIQGTYNVDWTITGLVNVTDGCTGEANFVIEQGSVSIFDGMPLFALPGVVSQSTNCSDQAPATDSVTVNMQATSNEGGVIFSDLPFLGDLMKEQQMNELVSGEMTTSTLSTWEITHTDTHTVLGVTGRYEQYFLQGIPVNNTYTATVDWQDAAPGGVTFQLNGVDYAGAQSGGPDTWTASMPLGDLPAGVYPMLVTATTASGQASPPSTKVVVIVPMPAWGPAANFTTLENDPTIIYRGKALFPKEPLEYLVSLPAILPLIGGDWGLRATQIQAGIEATSAGGPETDFITGTGGLALGGDNINLNVTGNTQTTMAADALTFDSGQAELSLPPYAYSKQVGLLDLVPGVSAVYGKPIIGDLLKALNSIMSVTGTIETQVTGKTDLGVENNEVTIVAGEVRDDLKVSLVANLGIDGVALAYVGGGGNGYLVLALYPETAVKDCKVNLFFLAGYAVFNFFTGGTIAADQYSKDWQIAQCEKAGLVYNPGKLEKTGAGPAEFTLAARPAGWQAEQAVTLASSSGAADITTLVSAAHPGAAPALAVGGERLAFAWVGEDAARPRGEAFEVFLRLYDGAAWGDPIRLTDDAAFDTDAAAAFAGEGQVVVAWATNPAGGLAEGDALDEAFVSGMEIAYVVVDATSGAVVSRGTLTQNATLDFGVQLGADGDGGVWAAWQTSPANGLVGTAAAPNALLAARWDGAAWGETQTASETLTGTLWWQLAAHDAQTAMILADTDTDGDLATGADREITALAWDGAAWTARQLTDNEVADLAPRAAYTPEGEPAAAWLSGGQVVGLTSDLTAVPQVWLAGGVGTALGQGRLVAAEDGKLALVWPDMSPAGPDVLASKLDTTTGTWGAPEPLLASADAQEASLTAAAGPDGSLWLGYASLAVETRSITLPDGQTLDIPAAADIADLAVTQVADYFVDEEPVVEAPAAETPAAAEDAGGGGSRVGVIIALAALGLAVLGAGAWLVLRKKK